MQNQRLSPGHTMTLQTYNPQSTSYTLWFLRYRPNKALQVKVTTARSKVKSRSHHDILYILYTLAIVPTQYQLPTPYSFQDMALTRFFGQGHYGKVKGQIKVTPCCCTPTTPNKFPYKVSTSYTLRLPRYSPDKIL